MTNKIENIGDMMAYACDCGSVHFNLLKSKKIECVGCGNRFGNWETNNLADMLLDQQLAIVADGLQIPVERLKQAVEVAKQSALPAFCQNISVNKCEYKNSCKHCEQPAQ